MPFETAEILRQLIPGAEAIVFDEGGHILQEDLAERSAAEVRSFLHDIAKQQAGETAAAP